MPKISTWSKVSKNFKFKDWSQHFMLHLCMFNIDIHYIFLTKPQVKISKGNPPY